MASSNLALQVAAEIRPGLGVLEVCHADKHRTRETNEASTELISTNYVRALNSWASIRCPQTYPRRFNK